MRTAGLTDMTKLIVVFGNFAKAAKIACPCQEIFVLSCTLFILHTYLFLCLDCPAFCHLSVCTTHNTNSHYSGGIFFLLSLCRFSVLLCPDCPGFAFCTYCTTQTSMPPAGLEPATPATDWPQTLALDRSATGNGWIRTRNYSNQSTADSRLRQLGHWDPQDSNPGTSIP